MSIRLLRLRVTRSMRLIENALVTAARLEELCTENGIITVNDVQRHTKWLRTLAKEGRKG